MKYLKLKFWMWVSVALSMTLVMFLHRVLGWGFVPTLVSAVLLNALIALITWPQWKI